MIRQLEDLSSPISAFIRDKCVVARDVQVEVDALWTAWKQWCDGDNRPPGTKAVFGRDLCVGAADPETHQAAQVEWEQDANRPYRDQGLELRENYS